MNKIVFAVLLSLMVISCGNQRQLVKSHSGKSLASLRAEFGNPVTIIENENDSIFIYEKTEGLKGTEISQGRLTLDPIYTPPVTKTVIYYFTVTNRTVTDVRSEEEYERD
ncbi:MAG: hypothetical protein ACOC0R_04095 [Mariniphaga sp.]